MASPDELVVVSGYYNPCRYHSRRKNHDLFCESLDAQGVTHLTLECAFPGQDFELPEALHVLRVPAGTQCFQSERLYNLLASWLPDTCRYVAWVDCDVLFANPNWAAEAVQALQAYPVVQLFERCHRLPENGELSQASVVDSLGAVMQRAGWATPQGNLDKHGHTGYAWAMRRELFDEVGLYEGAIAGVADHMMAHAFYADYGTCVEAFIGTSPRQMAHFRAWGAQMHARVQGRLGVVAGDITHLWHGSAENRRYLEQLHLLCHLDYDPATDIVAPFGRPVEWSKGFNKPAVRQMLDQYFIRRREDGDMVGGSSNA